MSHQDSGQVPASRLVFEHCAACGQLLAKSAGCPDEPYPTAYRWGNEPWFSGDKPELDPLKHCPDCWAEHGMPHHHDCTRAYCEPCDEPLFNCAHAEVDE